MEAGSVQLRGAAARILSSTSFSARKSFTAWMIAGYTFAAMASRSLSGRFSARAIQRPRDSRCAGGHARHNNCLVDDFVGDAMAEITTLNLPQRTDMRQAHTRFKLSVPAVAVQQLVNIHHSSPMKSEIRFFG